MAVCFGMNAQVLKVSDAPVEGNWAANTTWYLIQNHKGGYVSTADSYCNTEGKLILNNQNAPGDENENALWCVVGNEETGYKFYNKANGTNKVLLASRVQNSADASFNMADATDAAGEYFDIANSSLNGYVVIYDHNNTNADASRNNYWNMRGNNLAYWFATTGQVANDTGSAYAFLNIDEYEATLAEAEAVLETSGFEFTPTHLLTKDNADQVLYSNAYCTDTRYGDAFTNWQVLVDDNSGTFFHSEYASGKSSSDGLNHYIRMDLGADNDVTEFYFSYTTRNHDGQNDPKNMVLEGSNEENGEYTTIQSYTNLPSAANYKYTSGKLTNAGYRYIRFRVTETYDGRGDASGNDYFFLAELRVFVPVATVKPEYEAYKDNLIEFYNVYEVATNASSVKDRSIALYNMNNALDVVDRTLNPEFYALQDKIAELSTIVACGGKEVGHYANVESIATAIAAAQDILDNESSTASDYTASLETLNALNPQINLPEEGKFYNIVSACTVDHRGGQMIYVNEDGAMQFARNDEGGLDLAKGSLGQVVQFVPAGEGQFNIYFVARDTYLSTAKAHNAGQEQALAKDVTGATKVEFTNLGKENVVKITPVGGAMLHAQDAGSKVVGWDNDDYDNGSAWKIVEIEDPTTRSFDLTIGEAGYATLYLGCAVTIPTGVEAYAVSEIKDGYVEMTAIENAIPAGEAVILKKAEDQLAEATSYSFNYTATANAIDKNELKGSTINTYVEGPAYVLGYINVAEEGEDEKKEVGLYKAVLNADATGATGESHFKNNANKAYLVVENAANVASYSFRFGEGTTGVEKVEIRNEKSEIYDLTGRKVEEITAPGIYVVNGKKLLVK